MKKNKLFDFAIGNPPYQEEKKDNGRQPPIYNVFIDEAYEVADKVMLIHPARFLRNEGQTPKAWNRKMLSDPHLSIVGYEPDAKKVFPSAEIKGGICISYHDSEKSFGPIGTFITNPELQSIKGKVENKDFESFSSVITGAVPYKFTEKFRTECPDYAALAGESFDLRTNCFKNLENKAFFKCRPSDSYEYVRIYGLLDNKRISMWVRRDFISGPDNFTHYKVLLAKACGAGKFGEVLSAPIVIAPNEGHTQSFISFGSFQTKEEAENLSKYIHTKFVRALLGIMRSTQDVTAFKWRCVPLQDFTTSSDIDWSQSIKDIDQQLYRKYGLSNDEIEFIETHVKEMN